MANRNLCKSDQLFTEIGHDDNAIAGEKLLDLQLMPIDRALGPKLKTESPQGRRSARVAMRKVACIPNDSRSATPGRRCGPEGGRLAGVAQQRFVRP